MNLNKALAASEPEGTIISTSHGSLATMIQVYSLLYSAWYVRHNIVPQLLMYLYAKVTTLILDMAQISERVDLRIDIYWQ